MGAYIHFKDLNQSIFINKASVFGFNGFEFFENLKIGDSYNFIIKDYKENTISLNKNSKYSLKKRVYNVQPSSLVSNSLSQKSFNITNINMFIYFSFLIFNDLTDTSKDLKTKKKYLNISRDLGIHLHHPKVYVLNLKNSLFQLIKSLKRKKDIRNEIIDLNEQFETKYVKTFEIFPHLTKLKSVIQCFEYYNSLNFEAQVKNINTESLTVKKLVKLILIKNLIQEENSDLKLIEEIRLKIIDLLQFGIDDVFNFDVAQNNETVDSENIRILKQVESKQIIESVNYEFKETIKTPVLTNEDHNKIDTLNNNTHIPEDIKEKKIDEILNSKNINDKLHQNAVTYSAFKNICALLNSNNGKILIGVRDNNELVGLKSDYRLVNDFDGFQLYFDTMWSRLLCEPEKYRPYVSLNKIHFNGKDFCFIDVEKPNDFDEPCFIYDYKGDKHKPNEMCYVKANASAKSLSPIEISKFKRSKDKFKPTPNYVYIMTDKFNYYKIGHSKDPDSRQGTLMSQDREIKIIHKVAFPSKDLAMKIEKHLHREFQKLHKRGEWFEFKESDLKNAIAILDKQKNIFSSDKQKSNL